MGKSLHDFVAEALRTIREVEPSQVQDREPEVLLLDVREPYEFESGHIPGAINVPRGFLEVKADLEHPKKDERLADRSQEIMCYCGGGHRSALAAKTLAEMGFGNVSSMSGGWSAWREEGRPSETGDE